MDMLSLEIFIKTADEGNMTKAAGFLHLSQPTASRRIQELEEELGRPLFIRTNKAVSLTDEGRQFLEAASDMLTIYRKALTQEKEQQQLKGDIYIGSGEIPAFSVLAEQIRDFRKLQPGICFHILSGNADEIRDDVEKGVLDLGLITRSVNTETFESLEYADKTRWGILVRNDHPLALRERIRIEDLEKESLILPENQVYYRELTGSFSEK
ncbi:MAG: LysR family transcriptional regulator, partial [Lachnospiraceae bacterium]|nr:LysR family transcriptional regulator [Lachnospiraceae bacterium]